jgi:SSS family solute:Na+ symporter
VPLVLGSIFLASIVFFYVAAGGIRSVAWVDALQAFLLFLGIVVIGSVVLNELGGWDSFIERINVLEDRYLEVPGAWEATLIGETKWTGMFQMTYMFSLMGIMASPAFHMWAFSNKDPKPFPWQQVFASTLFIGFALFFFTAIQGLGGRALFEDGVLNFETDAQVVPQIIDRLIGGPLAGFVVVGALAAMQSTGAAYMGTGGAMLMRDVYVRYMRPDAGHAEQVWVGRFLVFVIVSIAMWVALTNTAALVMLGGLATAFGFLLYVPLVDTLFLHKFTRQGVALGLAFGIAAVIVTYAFTSIIYPMNIHSAGWGGIVGFATAIVVTLLTRRREEEERADLVAVRRELTQWLADIDSPNSVERKWRRVLLVVTPLWFIFAIGPGMVLGNNFVSFAGLPPVWSWQITWWVIGLVMMWGLAFKGGLSRPWPQQIERAIIETRPVIAEVGLRRKKAPAPAGGGGSS